MKPRKEDLERLHQLSEPSSFGHGSERVEDVTYRFAREIKADDFCFNFDPLSHQTGILAAISAFCKVGVEGRLYKLNSYMTGKPSVAFLHPAERPMWRRTLQITSRHPQSL